MRHGGEYFFEYKDLYCLLDNEKIHKVLGEIKLPAEKRVTYFHALPGLKEIELEIQIYLESKLKKDKEAFIQEYHTNEYYGDDAKHILSFYLRGYSYKVQKACYGDYSNKKEKQGDLNSMFSNVYKIAGKNCYSISLFNVFKLIFIKFIRFNGHLRFSENDIKRLDGSLENFFLELKNGIIINFNQNYVDIYVISNINSKYENEDQLD